MACSHCDFEFTALMSSCDQTNSDVASVSGDCCEDIFMRYYGFYQFSTIVCKCFRIYLLCFGVFLESLQVYVCFGTMWWLWIILDIKTKETRSCSLNQSESTFRINRRSTHHMSSIDIDAWERAGLFKANLKLKFHIITKLSLPKFNLICMCSVIVLVNTRFLIFYYSQYKVFRIFSSLERRSNTP